MSNAICKWCKREWLHLGMDDKCPYCRVRELEATVDAMAEAHAHDDMALTAAYLSGAHEGKKQAEAFKARVMAWARGSCGICAHAPCHHTSQGCKNCTRFRGGIPGEKADNWTPPQAWGMGE